MKKTEIKKLIREIIKEVISTNPKLMVPSQKDERIRFDIEPYEGKSLLVVKYRNKTVGVLVPEDNNVESVDRLYTFETKNEDFKVLNGYKGTLKLLKVKLLRVVDFRIEKNV